MAHLNNLFPYFSAYEGRHCKFSIKLFTARISHLNNLDKVSTQKLPHFPFLFRIHCRNSNEKTFPRANKHRQARKNFSDDRFFSSQRRFHNKIQKDEHQNGRCISLATGAAQLRERRGEIDDFFSSLTAGWLFIYFRTPRGRWVGESVGSGVHRE